MSEEEKKDKLSEQAKHKDDSNLVVDEKSQVKDIYDIIEEYKGSNSKSTVGKINKLTEYGGSIAQVVEKYNEISGGNVSNIDQALEYLEQAYRIVAQIISEAPNGYVINIETGELNEEKSKEQRIKYGIDEGEYTPSKDYIDNSDLFESMQETEDKKEIYNDTLVFGNDLDEAFADLYDFADDSDFIKEAFSNDDSEKELPKDIIEEYNETEKAIQSKDSIEMKFALLFQESQLHPERSKRELDNFMKQYPEYEENFLRIIDNGVNPVELELYNNRIIKNSFTNIMSEINKSSAQKLSELNENDKKGILVRALALMDVGTSTRYMEEVLRSVQKVFPQITDLTDFKTIGKILGKSEEEVLKFAIDSKNQFAKADIDREIDRQRNGKIKNHEIKDYFMKNNEVMEIDDINKSPHQKYFKDSKIPFSEVTERSLRRVSATCITLSWIEDKSKLTEYKFLSLVYEKERLLENLNKKDSYVTREQLEETEKKIKEFEKGNSDFDKNKYFEDGKLKKEYVQEIRTFERAKVKGDILSNYIEDEERIGTLEDYKSLPKKAKAKYLRDTLFGLADSNSLTKKMAMRRLEIISDEKTPLITFDEKNNPKMDIELLMQQCIEYDVVSREDSDILYNKDTWLREMSKYAREKLESYETVEDKYFVKLDAPATGTLLQQKEAKVKQIQQIKLRSKLEKSQNYINGTEQDKVDILQTSGRMMAQDEIDNLIKMMNETKEESIEEKFKATFSKSGNDFDNSMYDLIYENPMAAQEFLKQSLENGEISSTPNFQTKIMFLQSSIKQVEKEKLRDAFNKDEQSFKDEVEEMVSLSPVVAQEFLKEFVNDSQNSSINKFNEKVMMLQEKINKTLDEKGAESKEKSTTFLKAEEVDISSLPREVGANLIPDAQEHKLQDDDEPSL